MSYSDKLRECAQIAEDRQTQYGSPEKNFVDISNILKELFDITLTPRQIALVQVATKMARLKYKWKEDSVLDAANYLLIANELQ